MGDTGTAVDDMALLVWEDAAAAEAGDTPLPEVDGLWQPSSGPAHADARLDADAVRCAWLRLALLANE